MGKSLTHALHKSRASQLAISSAPFPADWAPFGDICAVGTLSRTECPASQIERLLTATSTKARPSPGFGTSMLRTHTPRGPGLRRCPHVWGLPGNSDCSRVLRCSQERFPIHRRGDLDPGSWPTFFILRQPKYGLSLRAWGGTHRTHGGSGIAPVHRLTDAGTPEPCACPGRSTPGTHRDMHARVHTAQCSRAHGRTGIQAWLSIHTTCRQLLASTRAPQ